MSYAVKEIFYTLQGEGAQVGRAAVFCRFAGCNLWPGNEASRAEAICRFCDTDFVGVDGPGGGNFDSAEDLAAAIEREWPTDPGQQDPELQDPGQQDSTQPSLSLGKRFVVCTGGEPLLQLDANLIAALHRRDFEVAVETNGTVAAPEGVDWLTVSPKAGAKLVQKSGDELKLIYPQPGAQAQPRTVSGTEPQPQTESRAESQTESGVESVAKSEPEDGAEFAPVLDPADFELLCFRHFFLQPLDGPDRAANTELALRYCLAHPQWRLSLQTHKILGIP
jgi:7-carboxy-7-deazaguanine synthase (Cx14CxxC type)